MGAYPPGLMKVLDEWYPRDDDGRPYLKVPDRFGDPMIRTKNFVGRPAGPELVRGVVQGRELFQFGLPEIAQGKNARLAPSASDWTGTVAQGGDGGNSAKRATNRRDQRHIPRTNFHHARFSSASAGRFIVACLSRRLFHVTIIADRLEPGSLRVVAD